jgi:hypothetical protein
MKSKWHGSAPFWLHSCYNAIDKFTQVNKQTNKQNLRESLLLARHVLTKHSRLQGLEAFHAKTEQAQPGRSDSNELHSTSSIDTTGTQALRNVLLLTL